MEARCYQILWVGDNHPDTFLIQKPEPNQLEIRFLRVFTYRSAVYSVQKGMWDAVFVTRNFDGHAGLEFIHHARLLETRVPIILLVEDLDEQLDYKARQIGADDCLPYAYLDTSYLYDLVSRGRKASSRETKRPNKPGILKVMESFLT